MATRREALPWILPAVIALFVAFVFFGVFLIYRLSDPLVTYYGEVMYNSELLARPNQSIHCMSLASSAFEIRFICFDTMQELDAFAATR